MDFLSTFLSVVVPHVFIGFNRCNASCTCTHNESFLKQAMMTFIETDYAIKSGTYEKDYLFDLALLKVANSV